MEYTPEMAVLLAGPVVSILVGILKRFGIIPDDRLLKQVTALVVSCIVVLLWPTLQGQPLPTLLPALFSIVQTWLGAMGAYAFYHTGQKLVAEAELPQ